MAKNYPINKSVETLKHEGAAWKNIPTAEHESIMHETLFIYGINPT
jgi:hypothetical protein